jgi:type I restriction enzyme S subunit
LAKAFRGELVAQLPTDGDARELLEQIKQAKVGERGQKQKDEWGRGGEDGGRRRSEVWEKVIRLFK